MPSNELPPGLLPSVLDRLIDPDSAGTARRPGYGPNQAADAVRRDLEDLLNTRQTFTDLPPDFVEARRSVVGYGLPDLVSISAMTPQQRDEIGRLLETVVATFEPRLRDVRATLLTDAEGGERIVRFRIDARLVMEPAPEVIFETVLDRNTGRYSVSQGAA
jgi:type VI secretion system protein ImpF